MNKSVTIQLDPHSYSETCKMFHQYFNIPSKSANLQYLEEMIGHFAKFPYENLSKIIRYHQFFDNPVRIRLPDAVFEDFRKYGTGGTCFSLTFFFYTLLTQSGYFCYPVLADMPWGENVHCAVVVVLDQQPWLVDPGYLLHRPMEITQDKPRLYKSPVSGVELIGKGNDLYELYTFTRTQTKWRYRFKNSPVPLDAFLHHWLESFRWNSMHGLCLTKVEKDRMIYIHRTFMRETDFQNKKNFNIKKNYHHTIQEVFGIAPEYIEEALSALKSNMTRDQKLGLWKPKKSWSAPV